MGKAFAFILLLAMSTATAQETLTAQDYQAGIIEANTQISLIAQRAQSLAATLRHANDEIATLKAELAKAKEGAPTK